MKERKEKRILFKKITSILNSVVVANNLSNDFEHNLSSYEFTGYWNYDVRLKGSHFILEKFSFSINYTNKYGVYISFNKRKIYNDIMNWENLLNYRIDNLLNDYNIYVDVEELPEVLNLLIEKIITRI